MAQKWEYAVYEAAPDIDEKELNDELDEWGGEGWELVSSSYVHPRLLFVFKQPVAE